MWSQEPQRVRRRAKVPVFLVVDEGKVPVFLAVDEDDGPRG